MAKAIVFKKVVGQTRIRTLLCSAAARDSLGHAYLFAGDSGVGKFATALELAMGLLCVSSDNAPCYTCESCRRVLQNAHGDFRAVMPLALRKEHRNSSKELNEDGWNFCADSVRSRITDPYLPLSQEGNATIPVEWIKEINQQILRGAAQNGYAVTILCDIDTFNKESANALLKTLEEPPPQSLLLLLTSRPQAVLPTILSRCQLVRFGTLPEDTIATALAGRLACSPDDERVKQAVAYSRGSLGRAVQLLDTELPQVLEQAREFLSGCMAGNWRAITEMVDRISLAADPLLYEQFFNSLAFVVRGTILLPDKASQTYINSSLSNPERAGLLLNICQNALYSLQAHGVPALVLAQCAASLMECMQHE